MKQIDSVYIGFFLIIGLFLLNDFFGFLPILPPFVYVGLLLLLVIVSLVSKKETSQIALRKEIRWNVMMLLYLPALILVFSLFGGKSTAGFGFTQPPFWIAMMLLLITIYSKRKRLKLALDK